MAKELMLTNPCALSFLQALPMGAEPAQSSSQGCLECSFTHLASSCQGDTLQARSCYHKDQTKALQ